MNTVANTRTEKYTPTRRALGLFLGSTLVGCILWASGSLPPAAKAVGGAVEWIVKPVGGPSSPTPSQFDKEYPKVYYTQPGQSAFDVAVESVGPKAGAEPGSVLRAESLIASELKRGNNARDITTGTPICLPNSSYIGTSSTP